MYRTMNEWLDETEGVSCRRERMPPEALPWVEAAWKIGAAAEREACAKIADNERHDPNRDGSLYADYDYGWDGAADRIAEYIRARNEVVS